MRNEEWESTEDRDALTLVSNGREHICKHGVAYWLSEAGDYVETDTGYRLTLQEFLEVLKEDDD